MANLPVRTVIDDVVAVCGYLSKKPTGAPLSEARKVLDTKFLDGRKLAAMKVWGLVEEADGRLKLTPEGRLATKDGGLAAVLLRAIRRIDPYRSMVERAAHRKETTISATDTAVHWHEHHAEEASDNDNTLNDQAVCFFHLAQGAELGQVIVGRKGSPTRFEFDPKKLAAFVDADENGSSTGILGTPSVDELAPPSDRADAARATPVSSTNAAVKQLGQAIFIAHGKNKKPLEQLKRILEQFKIPYRVAIDEPNLGRPIGGKVRETMEACNCAVLLFTADEEFRDTSGKEIWRPSENVVYELGASGYLYGNRIVIMKESGVQFPSNFRDLGHISFEKDQLDAKAMDILRELIGFGIVKVST